MAAEDIAPVEQVVEEAAAQDLGENEEDIAELDEEMQAAIDGDAAASPENEEDEEDDEDEAAEGEEVAAHLKESVEGSLRMKRLLENDGDEEPVGKKAKKVALTPEKALITRLMAKWQLSQCLVTKYVLSEVCDPEDLKLLESTSYFPDLNHWQKSAPDLLARHVNDNRERKTAGGGPLDVVSTFKFRFKLDGTKEKILRGLKHKELRYVLDNYDGSKPLEEVVQEAAVYEPEDECTENALPDGAGVSTIGRFGRLELIDPVADAAVFGDANLTFAIKLARHRKAFGHVGRVVATTFEDLPTLRERYQEIDSSIKTLEDHFAEVYHSIDCTRIAVDERFKGMENSLGAVYYNFPHSGAIGGFFDGHPLVN